MYKMISAIYFIDLNIVSSYIGNKKTEDKLSENKHIP